MVLAELAKVALERRTGRLIVNEKMRLPYRHETFREAWREDRKAAGIPKMYGTAIYGQAE
jgi:hypothetical protein